MTGDAVRAASYVRLVRYHVDGQQIEDDRQFGFKVAPDGRRAIRSSPSCGGS
jgi:hypothetical protein